MAVTDISRAVRAFIKSSADPSDKREQERYVKSLGIPVRAFQRKLRKRHDDPKKVSSTP